jgi:NTP pyrophosphatase (non-canonical NTP hydrolase)
MGYSGGVRNSSNALVNIDALSDEIHSTAVSKGFWDRAHNSDHQIDFLLAKLALIASEVSEVLEAIRKSKGEQAVMEEISDIVIRTLDFASGLRDIGYTDLSLQEVLLSKMGVNAERPRMHGVLA